MSNRFKRPKRETELTEEELSAYLATNKNAGATHDHPEWAEQSRQPRSLVEKAMRHDMDDIVGEFDPEVDDSDKARTIERNLGREAKIDAQRSVSKDA